MKIPENIQKMMHCGIFGSESNPKPNITNQEARKEILLFFNVNKLKILKYITGFCGDIKRFIWICKKKKMASIVTKRDFHRIVSEGEFTFAGNNKGRSIIFIHKKKVIFRISSKGSGRNRYDVQCKVNRNICEHWQKEIKLGNRLEDMVCVKELCSKV
tara:strand:- start:85 stop:558 length:474 start_codon:yes stop_codon:yes gene_type:complete